MSTYIVAWVALALNLTIFFSPRKYFLTDKVAGSIDASFHLLIFSLALKYSILLLFDVDSAVLQQFGLHGEASSYYGFERIRGFFLEPSLFGIACCFYHCYYIRFSRSKRAPGYSVISFALIILSLSSLAYIYLLFT